MDMDRIKRNVAKMVQMNAPEGDIDAYIVGEGASLDAVRAHKPGMAPQSAAPQAPEMTWGETGADVAKSGGIGLVQGALGLGTLPGNIEQLGRMGINKGAELLGYEPPVSNDAALPTYGDAKAAVENMVGQQFYEPKSTAGEYARTIGEFAPMAATGGAGMVGRVANVVAPAVMSETAGQVTKGTPFEPYARVAGAFAGGTIPRAVTPLPADASRTAMVKELEKHGVTALTAGQKTGSQPLRWAESVTQDVPFGGTKAKQLVTTQQEQFTKAALRLAGVKDATRASDKVINQAFDDLGRKFEHLAGSTAMRVDKKLSAEMADALTDYQALVPESLRAPYIQQSMTEIMTMSKGRPLPGEAYAAVRSRLERMRRQAKADPQLGGAEGVLTRMRDALDDAMERSMPGPRAKEWKEVRGQYRHLLGIEKAVAGAGENTALGLISPSQLRTAMKTQSTRSYVRGKDELGNLARAGEAIMKPLPQSGTAPRAYAQGALGIGSLATGGLDAGLSAMAGQALASRALMSKPMQYWLANQRAAPALSERPARAMNALVGPQLLAQHGGLVGRQTTGPYPPGDPRWLLEDEEPKR
jgi:hypothetical protein